MSRCIGIYRLQCDGGPLLSFCQRFVGRAEHVHARRPNFLVYHSALIKTQRDPAKRSREPIFLHVNDTLVRVLVALDHDDIVGFLRALGRTPHALDVQVGWLAGFGGHFHLEQAVNKRARAHRVEQQAHTFLG